MTDRTVLLVLLLFGTAACRPDEQKAGDVTRDDVQEARATLSPEAAAHLDGGNAAYRAGDYRKALEEYEAAATAQPQAAAAWFGVYMAQTALGNADAADAAMERAQALQPGATLIHPTAQDSPGPAGSGSGAAPGMPQP